MKIMTVLYPDWYTKFGTLVLCCMLLCGFNLAHAQDDQATGAVGVAASASDKPEADPKVDAQSRLESSMDNVKAIEKTLKSLRKEIDGSQKGVVLNRGTIKDGLDTIQTQLKESHAEIDQITSHLTNHDLNIDRLTTEQSALKQALSINASDISSQKYLIENYAAAGYETLLKIAAIGDKLESLSQGNSQQNNQKQDQRISLIKDLNRLWMLISTVLVFLLPLAFMQANAVGSVPDNYLMVCFVVMVGYILIGFGLMFGASSGGWIGVDNYVFAGQASLQKFTALFGIAEFMLFQLGLVLFAALLVSSIIGSVLTGGQHLTLAVLVCTLLVPVYGHWAWAGHFLANNNGWLAKQGFLDNSNGTSIHFVPALFAWILLQKLYVGPIGAPQNTAVPEPIYTNKALVHFWLGSLGLLSGTLSVSGDQIPAALLNATLAAATAGLSAYLHYGFKQSELEQGRRGLGGFATGLVAISICAQSISLLEAMVLGALAGVLYNQAIVLIGKNALPQPQQSNALNLVCIHAVGALWGGIGLALLSSEGSFSKPITQQFLPQLEGLAVAVAYSVLMANLAWYLFNNYRKRISVVSA